MVTAQDDPQEFQTNPVYSSETRTFDTQNIAALSIEFNGSGTLEADIPNRVVLSKTFEGSGTVETNDLYLQTNLAKEFNGSGSFDSVITLQQNLAVEFNGSGTVDAVFNRVRLSKEFNGSGSFDAQDLSFERRVRFSNEFNSTGNFEIDLTADAPIPEFDGLATVSGPMTVFLKVDSNKPDFQKHLLTPNGYLDLSSVDKVEFIVKDRYTRETVFETEANIVNSSSGLVSVEWDMNGFSEEQSLLAEFNCVWSDDGNIRVPSRGFIPVQIISSTKQEVEVE